MDSVNELKALANQRIVIIDGAMGTMIQQVGLRKRTSRCGPL